MAKATFFLAAAPRASEADLAMRQDIPLRADRHWPGTALGTFHQQIIRFQHRDGSSPLGLYGVQRRHDAAVPPIGQARIGVHPTGVARFARPNFDAARQHAALRVATWQGRMMRCILRTHITRLFRTMKKFICEQNIANFERLLAETSDPSLRRTVDGLLASNRRELALLVAETERALRSRSGQSGQKAVDAIGLREQFLSDFNRSPHPYMLLDPGPGLQIVDINVAYAKATLTDRGSVVGRSLFEVFPDHPDEPLADGVSNLLLHHVEGVTDQVASEH
ncbi:hypothetical protein ACSHT2_33700 [Bradyrhizobium sp. PUT101]|uniref:hypothetical protein n=1 Tax=Bradyrhizobium sp. PUT101 TaxID=3447427 RepID=UPI003F86F67B